MAATTEYYEHVIDAFPDTESLTVLVVSGASRGQVAAALGIDLSEPVSGEWSEDLYATAWAALEIPGGVLAVETTGFGDPTNAALRALSEDGRAAAVVRNNIQAHLRFGCARDGELLFDDDEFMYLDDASEVPVELRPLFDLVWDDLEGEEGDQDTLPDPFAVGLAMAELITGLEVTADQVATLHGSGFFKAPSLVYAASLGD